MNHHDPHYPLFVDVRGKKAVVIGAGSVAQRKIETLLFYGADVRVIAQDATETVRCWAEEGRLSLALRSYGSGDIADAFIVICATDNRSVNEAVYGEASENNCLVNVVDVPELCNFYVPSIVRRGPLQIAISTSGAAPTVSKNIRKDLEAAYGSAWGTYVSLLGELRPLVLERVAGGEAEHKPIFSALAVSDLYERVARGEVFDAEQVYARYISPSITTGGDRL